MLKELQQGLNYANFYRCNYDHFQQWLNRPYVSLGKKVEGNCLPLFAISVVLPWILEE